jgi:hypothetical protein
VRPVEEECYLQRGLRLEPDDTVIDVGGRVLHSLTSKLNLRSLRNTSLTLELNLSTFRTRPRVNVGHMGDKIKVHLSGNGQSKLKLS